ncbi:MAG: hypothetical protein JO316_26090 [Abitibacteriaceae bacterium]|nr:hypothetical protein [Abditibacteriaceae bacterium]MBV9868831.1 hypothetical protein [Abditibacteriaceae bacterium]
MRQPFGPRRNNLTKSLVWLPLAALSLPLLSGCPHSSKQSQNTTTTNSAAGTPRAAFVMPTQAPTRLTQDVTKAPLPAQPAAGTVHQQKFTVEKAQLQTSTSPMMSRGKQVTEVTQYHLTLRQGQVFNNTREVAVHITLKSGEKLPGRTFLVRPATMGTPDWQKQHLYSGPTGAQLGVVGVHMSWTPPGQAMPQSVYYSDKFSLRLQFGQPQHGTLPGQINLRLPDMDKSFIAGTFAITPDPQDPEPAWNGPPATTPASDISNAPLPTQPVKGSIYGQPFNVDKVVMESNGVLTFSQGQGPIPARDLRIFLFLNTGEKLDGKSYHVKPQTPLGTIIPHIFMEWSTGPSPAQSKRVMFMGKYSMNLHFGKTQNGKTPGQINLRLPDRYKSYIAGSFTITPRSAISPPHPAPPKVAVPAPAPKTGATIKKP